MLTGGVQPFDYYESDPALFYVYSWWCAAVFVSAGAATGLLAFAQDQGKSQYLFFQQRADYPRRVWLSRILIIASMLPVVWVAAEMVIPHRLVLMAMARDGWDSYSGTASRLLSPMFWLICCFLGGAGIAQLVTMVIRMSSGFVAFIVTTVLSLGLMAWCRSMMEMQGSFLVFVLPIAASCFAATWWLAPRWISGRLAKTSSFLAAGFCALVVAGTIGGWIFHRTTEYSVSEKAEDWIAFSEDPQALEKDPQKFEAAIGLRDALKELSFHIDDVEKLPREWSDEVLKKTYTENKERFEEISKLLDDPDCGLFLNPRSSNEALGQTRQLHQSLEVATRRHLRSGQADLALGSLIDELKAAWWIGANRHQCEVILKQFVDCAVKDSVDESDIRKTLNHLNVVLSAICRPEGWDHLYRNGVFEIQRKYGHTDSKESVRYQEGASPWNWNEGFYNWGWFAKAVADPGLSAAWMTDRNYSAWAKSADSSQMKELRSLMQSFRYTRVRLALTAWKKKHGEFPNSLDELCEGDDPLLKVMPCSIHTGRQFAYSGEGLDAAMFFVPESAVLNTQQHWQHVHSQYEVSLPTSEHWIEAGQPFLLMWSGAPAEKRAFLRQEISEVDDPKLITSKKVESA